MSADISTALSNKHLLDSYHELYTSKSKKVKMLLKHNTAVTLFLIFQNLFLAIKIRADYLRKHKKYRNIQNFIPPERLNGSFQPFSAHTHTHTFLKAIRVTILYFNVHIFSQHVLNTFHAN